MKPESSPKRTEAQRKEEQEDLGQLKSLDTDSHQLFESASRQHGRQFYDGRDKTHEGRALDHEDALVTEDANEYHDERNNIKHARGSKYSSPWLTVTPEDSHSEDGTNDAKHEDTSMKSKEPPEQPEHHHRHHHHKENHDDHESQLDDATEAQYVSVRSTGT